MEKTFAFLVIAQDTLKYNLLRKCQEKTWVKDFKSVAQVFYVYGKKDLNLSRLEVNEIEVTFPIVTGSGFSFPLIVESKGDLICESEGGWSELLPNTLSALKYLLETYNYDYVIRTNLSTYWNKEKLLDLIQELDTNKIFMGPIVNGDTDPFVAGYAMIFSKDTILNLIENTTSIDFEYIDDVAISKCLFKQSFKPSNVELPWVTIRNFASLLLPLRYRKTRPLAIKSLLDLSRSVGIRCREDRRIGPINFRLDLIHYVLIRIFITIAKRK